MRAPVTNFCDRCFLISIMSSLGIVVMNALDVGLKLADESRVMKVMMMQDTRPLHKIYFSPSALIAQPEIEQEEELDLEGSVEEESLWKVFIHNDDVTPMEFVVIILQRIFELNPLEAEHVMLIAHLSGLAYVCTLPLTEAKKRVGKAHFAAQLEGYPLTFSIEPE